MLNCDEPFELTWSKGDSPNVAVVKPGMLEKLITRSKRLISSMSPWYSAQLRVSKGRYNFLRKKWKFLLTC